MDERVERLNADLKLLSRTARTSTSVKLKDVSGALDNLLKLAREIGLNSKQIEKVCGLISSSSVGNGIKMTLIKCLIPSQSVSVEAVLTCFGWMNTPDATNNIQSLLLRWTIAVFDLIDDLKPLHSVYSYLFFHMKSDVLRKHVCPLITLLTKKEDVLKYRVDRLIRLRAVIENDPFLNEILSLYKFFCPHLVPFRIRTSTRKPLASSYQQWTNYINQIQQRNVGLPRYSNCLAFWRDEDQGPPPTFKVSRKEKYSENLPKINDDLGDCLESKDDAKSIHRISSFNELIQIVDRVKLPVQTLIVLRYPVLQNIVSCIRDKEYIVRFLYKLTAVLDYDFFTESKPGDTKAEQVLLEKLILFCQYLQESIPVVDDFLSDYLKTCWNGKEFVASFLKLITWTRLKSYDKLQFVLLPLKKYYFMYDVKYKVSVIYCLCELFENYVFVELERQKKYRQLSRTLLNPSDALDLVYLFPEEQEDYSTFDTLVKLAQFTNELIRSGLVAEDFDSLILHAAATFYILVLECCIENELLYYQVPCPAFVYGALFSVDASLVSHLCHIFNLCRQAISKIKSRIAEETQPATRQLLQSFINTNYINTCIGDIMKCLWLKQAFNSSQQLSVFKFPKVILENLFLPKAAALFSVYSHPAILPFAFTYNKTVAPVPWEETRIIQASVKGTELHEYFMYFSEAYMDSIPHFIELFGKSRIS